MDKKQHDQAKRTIVGGRPRRRGLGKVGIPRGIEVLVKKASLDPAFCRLLLEQRAAAAREIGLELTPSEAAILSSVPEAQLQAMIDRTKVPDAQRRIFLGRLGAVMLSAVVAGCTPPTAVVEGIRPEEDEATFTSKPEIPPTPMVIEKGIRPEDLTRLAEPTPTPETTPTSTPDNAGSQPGPEDLPSTPVT
jgi:hypothetical protein